MLRVGVSAIQCGLLLPPSIYVKYDRMRVYKYERIIHANGERGIRNMVAVRLFTDEMSGRQVKEMRGLKILA